MMLRYAVRGMRRGVSVGRGMEWGRGVGWRMALSEVAGGETEAKRKEREERIARLSSWASEDPERKKIVDEIIRVDHAGEYGAVRIYEGQLAVLQRTNTQEVPVVQEMKEQEEEHLSTLGGLVSERRVRPTALLPFWHFAGLALGAGSALLGKEAAHACTVGVEEAIGEHYNDQIRVLLEKGYDEQELLAVLRKNRDEELEHLHTAEERGAREFAAFAPLTQAIKVGCKAAIQITKVL